LLLGCEALFRAFSEICNEQRERDALGMMTQIGTVEPPTA